MTDFWTQFRSPEEKDRDQQFDEHLLNHMGDMSDCEFCANEAKEEK